MKTGILFAGQGSQHPGMGKDLYERFPAFRKAFDALTEQERQAAFEGPESELVRTEITQPVLLAFAAGVYNILREEIPGFAPDMAAGLSLGEYSALTAAGVFDFETALDLIRLRGRLMARQAEGTNAVMSAVIGMERGQLKEFVERAGRDVSKSSSVTDEGHEFVEIANYNCPGRSGILRKTHYRKRSRKSYKTGGRRSFPHILHEAGGRCSGRKIQRDTIRRNEFSGPVQLYGRYKER